MSYTIGIDLGGTQVKAVCVEDGGRILLQRKMVFEQETALSWAESIHHLVGELENELQIFSMDVGLSAPGLANRDGSAIACMPGRLHGLVNLDWTDFLKRARPVRVLNDAQAALLGETWVGAAKNARNAIMLTLGTGVGGAVCSEGKLLRGAIGRAGHLGHTSLDPEGGPDVTGTPGSLEDAIGNCTIKTRSAGRFESTLDLIRAYEQGDTFAAEVWLKSVRALGAATVSFINLFDPEIVVVGGGIATAGDSLFNPLQSYVDRHEWRPLDRGVPIVSAQLGEYAGAIGAAWNVLSSN